MLHFLTRLTRQFVFLAFIGAAIVLSALRIALFCIDLYKVEIENKLTDLVKAPVKIGKIHAHLRRGLKPELILTQIRVAAAHSATRPSIELQEIRLGIDLLSLLSDWQLVPASWITLVGAKFSVIHKADGSFSLAGLPGGDDQPTWLLKGHHYQLLQSEIIWLDQKNNRPLRVFKQVDIAIKNEISSQRHQLNILSHLPHSYGDTLRISADFSGDVFKPNDVNASLFIAGKNLHFSKLISAELPLHLAHNQDSTNFELWGTLKNSQLSSLGGQVNAKNLLLQRADKHKLLLNQISSRFDWRNQANNWNLAVADLSLNLANKTYAPAQFQIGSTNKTAQHLSANIKTLDLEAVQNLSSFFLPLFSKDLPNLKMLNDLSVKGQLRNTKIFADLKLQQYAINGQFQSLSIASPAPYPQLKNISGVIAGTEQLGVLTLNSKNANFIAQPMFRAPLAITQLTGQLQWQQAEKNWFLSSSDLKLNTPYAQSSSHLKITIPKDAQPAFVDLQSAFFNLNDVSNAKVYFPVTLMSKGLLHYLDQAFIKGQIKRCDLLLYGYLKDFPFIKHQGVFQVLFDAQDVMMKYAEDWPFFEHLNARILFENDGLEVNIKQAKAELATINNAKISIPSFTDSDYVLVQNGLFSSEINQGLDFLKHTPLPLPLKTVSEQLAFSGNTTGELDLKIPLTDKVKPKVSGTARVSGAQLKILAVDLPINNLSGVFRFSQDGFFSDTLTANGLGYPMQAKVDLKTDSTVINVAGKTSIKELQKQFGFPAQTLAQGASHYDLQLVLPFSSKIEPSLSISSNLQGVALALPDSLAKTAAQTKELTVKFNLTDSPQLPISVNYDQQLKAQILLNKAKKTVTAGAVVLGSGEPELPAANQFKVMMNQAHFSAPVWLAVLDKFQFGDDKAQLLTELEIHTPQLEWAGQQLGLFDLKLRQSPEFWSGTVDSATLKGHLQIPKNSDKDSKIKLEMEQIDLSSLMQLHVPKQNPAQNRKLPLFEITSQKLLLRGTVLGKLDIDTERSAQGVKFKHINVTGKDQALSLTGDWHKLNNQEITNLSGKLTAADFGALLKNLKLNDDIEETSADIDLALHWSGAPYQFSLAALSGTVDLNLEDGRISSIEPGFGRLLGVLAMEQWLRRLQLDFGDIYKKGLSFNDITGHFSLSHGKAITEDLTVNAVPATINLSGELNLVEQTLDQQISVIPKSLDAVPIAGTIVDEITTRVTQTLTGEYKAGYYLRSNYRVKGQWNHLNVLPLHEQDGLFKKTWRGLTDFSWITQPEQKQEEQK